MNRCMIASVLLATTVSGPSFAQTVQVLCDNLPPACIQSADAAPGYAIEVAVEAVKRAGLTPVVMFLPWARAQSEAQESDKSVIADLTRTPEREKLYHWIGDTSESSFGFITSAEPAINSYEEAKNSKLNIGVILGASGVSQLKAAGVPDGMIEQAPNELNFRKLEVGRLSAIFGVLLDNAYGYRQVTGKSAVIGKPVQTDPDWLASGLHFPVDQADKIAAALKAMKADGTREGILMKYR